MFKVFIKFKDDVTKDYMCTDIVLYNCGISLFTTDNRFRKFSFDEIFSVSIFEGRIVKESSKEVKQLEIL